MKHEFENETPIYRTPQADTAYAKAQAVWDNRLGALALSAQHWRRVAIGLVVLVVVLLSLLVLSLSWHKPDLYIARVSTNGEMLNVDLLPQHYEPQLAEKEYFIIQFIKAIRTLPLDPVAAKNNWVNAYHFLSERGAQLLNHRFEVQNPVLELGKKTVTITIDDINPISENTFHVNWSEENVNAAGQFIQKVPMSGVFTISIQTPTTKEQMLENPLGIYVVDFNY